MIVAPLLLAFTASESVRPMTTEEMKGLRIWRDHSCGVLASNVKENVRERWTFAFKNDTPLEIHSITVREVMMAGGERVYESAPVTITKFTNLSAPYVGSLLARNKSADKERIDFEIPAENTDQTPTRTTEIVGATTFENPNLHDAGHLYTKMQAATPVEMIVLLRKDPSLLKVKSADGLSAALMAFGTSDVPVVQYVMEHGGNPSDQTKNGSTIMHLAAINGRPAVLDYALKLGGKVSARTKSGQTPLIGSIITGQPDAWRWLLLHGAAPGEGDKSPARYAIEYGQELALAALVRAGAKPQALDKSGLGWMHYAVSNYPMLEAVAQYHVPVDQLSVRKVTPLMLAAESGSLESQAWLLRHGAKPEATDWSGRTSFDYAKSGGIQTFPQLVERFENANGFRQRTDLPTQRSAGYPR